MTRGATHPSAAQERRRGREPARPSHPSLPDRKLTAEEINRLPMTAYDGPIHLVRSHAEMLAAAAELRRESLLGFDTETRPSFAKGERHPPALLQLAGCKAVYLFQLRRLGLPRELAAILADAGIVKAGVAPGRDLRELATLTAFEPAGFVDLGACAMRLGLQHHGLRGLCALLLGGRISKGAQLTNWERSDLPAAALRYAATDAWVGRGLYVAMQERGGFDRVPRRAAAAGPAAGARRGLWHQAKAAIRRWVGRGRRGTQGGKHGGERT